MRIHWFSPLPPARTDIAHFTARVLPALAEKADVVLWTDQAQWSAELERYAAVRRFDAGNPDWSLLHGADATFFNIGNSSRFHRDIWQVCRRYPGITILHDVLLHDAIVNHCRISPEVGGVYPDGWTSERMTVAFGASDQARRLTVRLRHSDRIPDTITVSVADSQYGIACGQEQTIVRNLPAEAGTLGFLISPALPPGEDPRTLGCRLEEATISGRNGEVVLNGRATYLDIMGSMYGARGRSDARWHWDGVLSLEQMARAYSCAPYVLPASLAAVVHSRAAERILQRETQAPVERLDLPFPAGSEPAPHTGAPPWQLIVFGYLGPNRGLDCILAALRSARHRDRFHLHIYGELHDPDEFRELTRKLLAGSGVTFHGFVPEEELEAALANAHLAINLRYPTRGEASGSQLRIWRHGLPSVVTKTGWFAELPENTVAFVRPECMTEDLVERLDEYASAPERFAQMGMNGRCYFVERHSPERYAVRLIEMAGDVQALGKSSRLTSPSKLEAGPGMAGQGRMMDGRMSRLG